MGQWQTPALCPALDERRTSSRWHSRYVRKDEMNTSHDGKVNVTRKGGKQPASPADKLAGQKPQRTDKPGIERGGSGPVKEEKKPNTE